MNEIMKRSFDFNGNILSVIVGNDGNPWWIAKEVCDVLGYANGSRDAERHCKHMKLLRSTESVLLGFNPRGVNIIPESDLYRLIIRSSLPAAEAFEKFVFEEVLPSIRKTGGYQKQAAPQKLPVQQIKTDIEAAIELAKIFGLEGNQAKLSANTIHTASIRRCFFLRAWNNSTALNRRTNVRSKQSNDYRAVGPRS